MKSGVNKSLLAIAVASILAAPAANATNGYFMTGYSTKEKGLAGAGVAFSQDAMASSTNPAGMAFVGTRLDLGAEIFSPSPRSYTVTGAPDPYPAFGLAPQKVESENDFFLIPHLGYNYMLNDKSAVGVAIYGNGGMNTEFKATAAGGGRGPFGAGTAGVNLEQMLFNFSYAYKLKKNQAIGASIILAGQRFSAQGLENFAGFSLSPTNLSGNRHSIAYGAGFKLGYQGELAKGFRVGISYQSKIKMGKFNEYKGLFAENGGFDIPSTYTLGLAYDIHGAGTIVADYQRIMYSDIASISNPISNLTGVGNPPSGGCAQGVSQNCLGGSNGAGFGWQDIGIIKLGYQWNAANIDWRVGYSHADQPIPNSETIFNILAPAVNQDHASFGLTKEIGTNQEFNFAFTYALNNSVTGPNAMDPSQKIKLEMKQYDVQAGWAWKF